MIIKCHRRRRTCAAGIRRPSQITTTRDTICLHCHRRLSLATAAQCVCVHITTLMIVVWRIGSWMTVVANKLPFCLHIAYLPPYNSTRRGRRRLTRARRSYNSRDSGALPALQAGRRETTRRGGGREFKRRKKNKKKKRRVTRTDVFHRIQYTMKKYKKCIRIHYTVWFNNKLGTRGFFNDKPKKRINITNKPSVFSPRAHCKWISFEKRFRFYIAVVGVRV